MKPNTFNKPIIDKPVKRNNHLKIKLFTGLSLFVMLFVFFGLFAYLTIEYKNTHTFKFQNPIILRTPVEIKYNIEVISPISTHSALPIAYAQEVENPFDPRSPKGMGWEMVKEKWGFQEWGYFEELIQRESGWNPYAINQSSGACGLGQALPCNKLGVELWDYSGQLEWIGNYIENRYGTPKKALQFHDEKKAETGAGWY